MASKVTGINPDVLKWAREASGYSPEEVAAKLKKDRSVIRDWESGKSSPTYVQLETLAYQVYNRPIALFFFPKPPEEIDPKKSFRTLPEFEIERLQSNTRLRIREAKAMQLALSELCDGVNPSENKIFSDINITAHSDVAVIAKEIRNYLGVGLDEQKSWGSHDQALKRWREAVQEKGIFIFKNTFKQKDVSGFCLLDDEFPVIYLNNSTALSRQIFTLFHELAHILLNTNGITLRDDNFINKLIGEEKAIEVFCNHLSAEFLVPSDDFFTAWHKRGETLDEDTFSEFADMYQVSREVILRKLLNNSEIDSSYYEKKRNAWIKQYETRSKKKDGGHYYATQSTYLGDKFISLAFNRFYQGRVSMEQLADFLNIKVSNVPKLEEYFLSKAYQQ